MEAKALSPVGTIVKLMVQALVDHPARVEVEEIEGTQATVIEVRVAPSDMGKLIGRQGRTAEAIRDLLVNFGRGKRRFILEPVEPDRMAGLDGDAAGMVERIDRRAPAGDGHMRKGWQQHMPRR